MSVKFKEAIQEKIRDGNPQTLAHELGAAITKGSGPKGYLAVSSFHLFIDSSLPIP